MCKNHTSINTKFVCVDQSMLCKYENVHKLYIVDVERFAGLNVHDFKSIEVFEEILSCFLGQKCLLFNVIIKQRCFYSWKNFHSTLENQKSLAQ